jgi:Penicillin-binding protein 5, C-terminal domain
VAEVACALGCVELAKGGADGAAKRVRGLGGCGVVGGRDVVLALPKQWRRNLQARVRYDAPVPAPITKGLELGRLQVSGPGVPAMSLPLLAGADVNRLGLVPRIPRCSNTSSLRASRWNPTDEPRSSAAAAPSRRRRRVSSVWRAPLEDAVAFAQIGIVRAGRDQCGGARRRPLRSSAPGVNQGRP